MKSPQQCSDCGADLQPIKLIDATTARWSEGGGMHVNLAYAAPEAKASFFTCAIPKLGTVRGMICPSCGHIKLYGEPV